MDKLLNSIAILFDADNTKVGKAGEVIKWVSKFGNVTVKRAYGNFQKAQLKPWEEACLKYAIHPIQQFDYVKGKNASDFALLIDALDLLHSGKYDGFVIVSSDSDFTPLLIKLHEQGVATFGVGEKKTPQSFINACTLFYALDQDEDEQPEDETKAKEAKKDIPDSKKPVSANEQKFVDLLKEAFDQYQREDGYALLSDVGNYIMRVWSAFNIRDYGAKNLSSYIQGRDDTFEWRSQEINGVNIISFRVK